MGRLHLVKRTPKITQNPVRTITPLVTLITPNYTLTKDSINHWKLPTLLKLNPHREEYLKETKGNRR